MYTLFYPAAWFEERSFMPNTQDFSNEDTGSPDGLDANGLWLDVSVITDPSQPCVLGSTTPPSGQSAESVSIDGENATLHVISAPPQNWVHVQHHQWCYAISVTFGSIAARDAHRSDLDQILSSFKFNR
jgi:hypothetical protein